MPLFGKGFRFSMNLAASNNKADISSDNTPTVSIKGAYKLYSEEFYGTGSYGAPRKAITPSMVKLPPPFQPDPTDPDVIRAAKSTGNLTQPAQTLNVPPTLRKSTPEVSSDPRGGSSNNNRNSADARKLKTKNRKNEEKEQNKLDKKNEAEQKKRAKLEAQERAKQAKLQKEREKAASQEQAKQEKLRKEKEKADAARAKKEQNKNKTKEPKAKKDNKSKSPTTTQNPPPAAKIVPTNPLARGANTSNYNTNTLDSSISKTSGPPPYNEASKPADQEKRVMKNEKDDTGNTSFGKPIDESDTWDMVAQHRAQVKRKPASAGKVMLRLDADGPNSGDNSQFM